MQEGSWRWEEQHRLKPSEQSEWGIGRWNSKAPGWGWGERREELEIKPHSQLEEVPEVTVLERRL